MRLKKCYFKVDSREELEEDLSDEDKNFILLVKSLDKFFNNDKSLSFEKGKNKSTRRKLLQQPNMSFYLNVESK